MTQRAVVGKNLRGTIVNVVTQEDNAMVVKGSSVGRIPREDCRGMANVDVVQVPLDGEAQSHRRTVREIREVGANLVRVLSRPSGKGVLESSSVRGMLNPVTELSKRGQRPVKE
jgi:hypothetical protein